MKNISVFVISKNFEAYPNTSEIDIWLIDISTISQY